LIKLKKIDSSKNKMRSYCGKRSSMDTSVPRENSKQRSKHKWRFHERRV